jgi:hypothetical protein
MSDIVQKLWSFCHTLRHEATSAAIATIASARQLDGLDTTKRGRINSVLYMCVRFVAVQPSLVQTASSIRVLHSETLWQMCPLVPQHYMLRLETA